MANGTPPEYSRSEKERAENLAKKLVAMAHSSSCPVPVREATLRIAMTVERGTAPTKDDLALVLMNFVERVSVRPRVHDVNAAPVVVPVPFEEVSKGRTKPPTKRQKKTTIKVPSKPPPGPEPKSKPSDLQGFEDRVRRK